MADLYGTDVGKLNQQVKRNIQKFPSDCMFQLTSGEMKEYLKSQGGRRKLAYALQNKGYI